MWVIVVSDSEKVFGCICVCVRLCVGEGMCVCVCVCKNVCE